MSLSASSGLVLASHKNNFMPQLTKTNEKHHDNNIDHDLKKKKEEPQKVNPFNISQEELNSQMAALTKPVKSTSTETLGTMAYNNSGAESAGTMAKANNIANFSCLA